MSKTVLLIVAIAISFCLGYLFNSLIQNRTRKTEKQKQTAAKIEMKKVNGIGGIFFKCKNPDQVREWYKKHLGFDTDLYGARFDWLESSDPAKKGCTQWSTFPDNDTYFNPSTKDFMINYRVENLQKLVEQLEKEGVTIVDKMETYDYGRFIHIMDIEGNKIELWEPNYDYKSRDKEQNN